MTRHDPSTRLSRTLDPAMGSSRARAVTGWFALSGPVLVTAGLPSIAHAGECAGVVVSVDNDEPTSGYSEVNPENFQTHDVDACAGSYRYLSKYVGDESTDGRVIWQPTIATPGTYRVTTSFRASENRTDDADYVLFGDDGQMSSVVIDQRGDGCVQEVVGEIWCVAGGSCRLELDGTDDMKSDAADETVFELVGCDPPPPSPCDPLVDAGFEVCASSETSCEGVYAGGEGCIAYCATVGMTCVARYGGEPGCQQEIDLEIPCAEVNDHGSDYCVCMGDPMPPGTTGTNGGEDTSAGSDPTGASDTTGASVGDGDEVGSETAGSGSDDAADDAALPGSAGVRDGAVGCGCTSGPRGGFVWTLVALFGIGAHRRAPRADTRRRAA